MGQDIGSPLLSFASKQSNDLFFDDRKVSGPYILGVDLAIAADQESHWQPQNSPICFSSSRIAHDNRIIHLVLLIESAYRLRSVIHGNADDLQTLCAILILYLDKMRNLLAARLAPGCPEIQQNDLAAIR